MSSPRMSTPSIWPHVVALLHFLGLVLCCFVAVCLCTVVLCCLIVGGLRSCVCLNGKIKLPAGFRRRHDRLTPNLKHAFNFIPRVS